MIAGGGPAGMMLGLMLARAGVRVTVMEKHPDFLRDFRGDTVHASTLRLLDELGLGARFQQIPHRTIDALRVQALGTPVELDISRIPGPHKHIALVPQWDFLELLADAAADEPTFTLLRSTEVLGPLRTRGAKDPLRTRGAKDPLRTGGRVTGVTYRDTDGRIAEMRAALTVACDGRGSTLRSAAGLVPKSFGAPMDVWWFRLPRSADDPAGLAGVFETGHMVAAIDRGDYYQVAYIIPKGADAQLRAEGIGSLQRRVAQLVPWLADRVGTLTSFDDVKLLDVQLNRLRKWFDDGLLLIGDAAHAMSPVGGVGINLAIADAVAAASILAAPLRVGPPARRDLALVQARRWVPTVLVQSAQRVVHDRVVAAAVSGAGPARAPAALRYINGSPVLRGLVGLVFGYAVAIGPFPQRTPAFARR